VREICERYGIPYNTGRLSRQFGSVIAKIFRFALPGRSKRALPAPPRDPNRAPNELVAA
jgi:hypothetical protein